MNMTPDEKLFMWAALIQGVYCHRWASHIFGERYLIKYAAAATLGFPDGAGWAVRAAGSPDRRNHGTAIGDRTRLGI